MPLSDLVEAFERPFKGLQEAFERPFRSLTPSRGPFKAFHKPSSLGPIRRYKALSGFIRPYKALSGFIRPYKGLIRRFKAL